MKMQKRLQKILAVALMTSFLSTSFVMGVSEAASVRHNNGGKTPAQHQQIRPVKKSASGTHGVSAHKSGSAHKVKPATHKNTPLHKTQSIHKPGSAHKAQPLHKNGPVHHGPAVHKGDPVHHGKPMMHKGGPVHHEPVVYKGGPVHHGPVIHHHHHPAPPPPPPPKHHHHDDKRSMHTKDWIGALVLGGIIGAVIANNTGNHVDTVEYATE